MNRRDLLHVIGTFPWWPALGSSGCASERTPPVTRPTDQQMPTLFVAHGAPPLLDEPGWVQELGAWPAAFPRPRSILMVSAHWQQRPVTVGAARPVPLIYDFYGFPERFYGMTYPAPGAPALADRVRGLLSDAGTPFADDPARGLDHGGYVPLMCMYPDASVPVLGLSMPSLDPRALWALGRTLAPLRQEGVLIVGSGFLTHNMRALRRGPTPSWAQEFDQWIGEVLARGDVDALLDYRARAPAVEIAHPTHEHFAPVVLAAGAASAGQGAVQFPITGFWYGSFTRRSVQFG